jgi:orotidine-5'-phosphate decarboxylase
VGFADRLAEAVRKAQNPVMVGVDPRYEMLPEALKTRFSESPDGRAQAVGAFAREVVQAVAGRVAIVKFQAAFFEKHGPQGFAELARACSEARKLGLLVVMDGKRNDIGSTAEAYADAYLGRDGEAWDVDALTVNPYLGSDGIGPFVERASANGRGLFVLVRTSNRSAREFQDLQCEGRPLYRHVAERLKQWAEPAREASGYSAVGAVVGATYPSELAELRAMLPGIWFLVPGYGAQGGSARDVAAAFDQHGLGAVVNSSRGIAQAYDRPEYRDRFAHDWTRAVEQAALDMADDLAANTPAGRLRS